MNVAALFTTERYAPRHPLGLAPAVEDSEPRVDLPVVSAATFAGKPVPPRRWIVPDMIPLLTVTMVMGDGGVGKSILLLMLAVAIATGREWIGASPERGPVIFVSAEDDLDELHRRLEAIVKAMGLTTADLGHLHLVPLAGKDAVMGATAGKTGIVEATPLWRELVALVERIKPRLVILDTLADVFAGNENARPEARQFVGLLRGLAIDHDLALIVAVHPSVYGMSSGTGTSGSTAWSNSVRARLYLETIKGDDGREIDAALRVLRLKKSNYGPPGLDLRLRWANGVFLLDGPSSGLDKLAADAKAERIFLDLLTTLSGQGRDVSPHPSPSYAPAVFAELPGAEGLTKKALKSAMERLLAAKRIRVEKFGSAARERSRLVIAPPSEGET
jgi:RecA-family ATPase